MKKGISIALSLLMVVTFLHVTISRHYCQGNLAASKISLSGAPASCGMEETEKDLPNTGTNIIPNCCDDVVTNYAFDNNYFPSFTFPIDSYHNDFKVFNILVGLPVKSSAFIKSLYTDESPPGELMSTSVDLSFICIFRI